MIARQSDDLVENVKSFDDFSIDGVLAIQVWRTGNHQEELGAGRIWIRRSCRAEDALVMERIVKLLVDSVAGTAGAVAASIIGLRIGVSALDHEAGDDSVELSAIVETLFREFLEVLNVSRSFIFEESDHDFAVIRLHDGDFFADSWSCHNG